MKFISWTLYYLLHRFCRAGDDIYHFGIKSKKVVEKTFENMPNCTVAFRYLDHYYCFHGHKFSKFNPKTGEVHGKYPKETRDYFVRCPKFGKWIESIAEPQMLLQSEEV